MRIQLQALFDMAQGFFPLPVGRKRIGEKQMGVNGAKTMQALIRLDTDARWSQLPSVMWNAMRG